MELNQYYLHSHEGWEAIYLKTSDQIHTWISTGNHITQSVSCYSLNLPFIPINKEKAQMLINLWIKN